MPVLFDNGIRIIGYAISRPASEPPTYDNAGLKIHCELLLSRDHQDDHLHPVRTRDGCGLCSMVAKTRRRAGYWCRAMGGDCDHRAWNRHLSLYRVLGLSLSWRWTPRAHR